MSRTRKQVPGVWNHLTEEDASFWESMLLRFQRGHMTGWDTRLPRRTGGWYGPGDSGPRKGRGKRWRKRCTAKLRRREAKKTMEREETEEIAYCPQCGEETTQLQEGYCQPCCHENQRELDLHNAQYNWWQRLTDEERLAEIKRHM